jgi:hypothetical protein
MSQTMNQNLIFKLAFEYLEMPEIISLTKNSEESVSKINSIFNDLPSKVKSILKNTVFYLTDSKGVKRLKNNPNLLGLSQPKNRRIFINIEGIRSSKCYTTKHVFLHEIGHYLTYFFTDNEKKKYKDIFGQEAVPDQEQDADSFVAWMYGKGNDNINKFWNWYIIR